MLQLPTKFPQIEPVQAGFGTPLFDSKKKRKMGIKLLLKTYLILAQAIFIHGYVTHGGGDLTFSA